MKVHPSRDITGSLGSQLDDKQIVLCVTGSVAATRSAEIARQLMRRGAEVFVVMSAMAQKIIHPYLMEWATGNPVVTELTGNIEHVALAGEHPKKVDLILVAPATANTISKMACGIDDTPVTSVVSTALGSTIPILVVPAMHESMYRHPIVAENIQTLQKYGVEMVGPRLEEGKAKIADTKEIITAVIAKLARKQDLAGLQIMVTAGPTLEHIDPVRVITNRSSGKMGIAVATEALSRGATVTLIYGPGVVLPPQAAKTIRVETTKQMYDAVVSELESASYDIAIGTAAVADWMPTTPYPSKLSTRTTSELTLTLKPTPKIINIIKKLSPNTFLVPFRAVSNLSNADLIENGYDRLKEAQADMIAINDVGRQGVGFDVDTNELFIVTAEKKVIHIPLTTKRDAAKQLLDAVLLEFSRV